MEKEKNKSPSYAMRISLQINKVVWGMLVDGKPFAEAEINDMVSVWRWLEIDPIYLLYGEVSTHSQLFMEEGIFNT